MPAKTNRNSMMYKTLFALLLFLSGFYPQCQKNSSSTSTGENLPFWSKKKSNACTGVLENGACKEYPDFYSPTPGRIAVFEDGTFAATSPSKKQVWVYHKSGRIKKIIQLIKRPLALEASPNHRLFIGNTEDQKVDIFTRDGVFVKSFSVGVLFPSDIAVAAELNLVFVTDSKAHKVLAFDLEGGFQYEFGSKGTLNGQFDFPSGIAINRGLTPSRLVVTDFNNRRVQVFSLTGTWVATMETVPGTGGMMGSSSSGRPLGAITDSSGNIFVVDTLYAAVYVFNSSFILQRTISEYGEAAGQLRSPIDIAFADTNTILITNYLNNRIEKINAY